MQRVILKELREWIQQKQHKPVVLRGARQVGKTWLVRRLAEIESRQLIELNFERTPELISLFKSNDVKQIILRIEAHFDLNITSENFLIFLDEIQAAPELLAKLRWFAEELPELPVIAAGSLLEFVLEEYQYSMPVGRVHYMYVEPLSFEEFLMAKSKNKLLEFLQQYELDQEMPEILHAQLMGLVKEYTLVGGLPAAVSCWCESCALTKVHQVHLDLLSTYRDDFAKYTKRLDTRRLDEVLRAVPVMLGEKFVFSRVNSEVQSRSIKLAFDLLAQARLVSAVTASHGNGLPLSAEQNQRFFKAVLLDIGLASALLGLDLAQLDQLDELNMVNNGGIAEQWVGQQLRCLSPFYISAELHYWVRANKSTNAEIDYLIQHRHKVLPIEVKAGKTGTLKSLHNFMAEKQLDIAVRFNSELPSSVSVNNLSQSNQDGEAKYCLLSLPFYLLGQLHRLVKSQGVFR